MKREGLGESLSAIRKMLAQDGYFDSKHGPELVYEVYFSRDCEHGYYAAGGTLTCPACAPDSQESGDA